ncbi:MAG: Bax inhibitor-1/YccA family protein [Lachnospiraceae bacterium]|nr:Bax inhibitor-1/YccA family protein [Lachnospiraceae bacterium]
MADQYGNYTPYSGGQNNNGYGSEDEVFGVQNTGDRSMPDPNAYMDQMEALNGAASGIGHGFDNFGGGYDMNPTATATTTDLPKAAFTSIIAKSYIFMIIALAITAFAATTVSQETVFKIFSSNGYWLLFAGEIAIVLAGNWAVKKNNAILAGVLYTVYAYLTGLMLAVIMGLYSVGTIQMAFGCTAVLFAVMAVFGIVTKKDLTGIGSVLLFGLIGIIIAGVINFFLQNTLFDFMITCVGIVIFVGLIAYDSQKLKLYCNAASEKSELALSLFCAFQLYLDFINLFLKILRLLGSRRR